MDRTALRRTSVITPATDEEMLRFSIESDADEVMVDLEDSVRADEKAEGRSTFTESLSTEDWSNKRVCCRINGIDTRWWYEDAIELVQRAGDQIDTLVVPKVDSPRHVHAFELLLRQVEKNAGVTEPIGVSAQIESALGMSNVFEIARASERLEALVFGPGDYSASIGIGGFTFEADDRYPGHYWHHALSRIVHAAKGAGLQAIDGLYAEVEDTEGFRDACHNARALGCDGKWIAHPSQIAIANEVFGPNEEEARLAERIVEVYEAADDQELHAVEFEGEVIDRATYELAREIVGRARQADLL